MAQSCPLANSSDSEPHHPIMSNSEKSTVHLGQR